MNTLSGAAAFPQDAALAASASVAVRDVLKVQEGEKALIITNPETEVLRIATALYDALAAAKAKPTLIVQGVKGQMDNAEEAVIAAFESQPDIVMSIS
ncbi:MAG TPA: peptidase M17, partial [Rectinemataceae bacterium]|nr:peptidase M17 [Rectinemataceae bacterium]